jgi:hypothetical protein
MFEQPHSNEEHTVKGLREVTLPYYVIGESGGII